MVLGSARSGPSRVRDRLLANERRAKILVRLMRVVGLAAQLHVSRRRLTTLGKRDDMVEFQEPSFTAPAVRASAHGGASSGDAPVTSQPASTNAAASRRPTKPPAPVTNARIVRRR